MPGSYGTGREEALHESHCRSLGRWYKIINDGYKKKQWRTHITVVIVFLCYLYWFFNFSVWYYGCCMFLYVQQL